MTDRHEWLPTGHETLACQVEGCGLDPLSDEQRFYDVHIGWWEQQVMKPRMMRLEELCRELAYEYHSPNVSIRDHHDPAQRGWVVGHITTCQDVLCIEAVRLLGIKPPEDGDGEVGSGQADRGAAQGPG